MSTHRPKHMAAAAPKPKAATSKRSRQRLRRRYANLQRAHRDRQRRSLPRRAARWLPALALAATTTAAATAALTLDREPVAAAHGDGHATTPVLSARRVPELLAAPLERRRLVGELERWLAASPADSCLVVTQGRETLFEHNPSTPLPGASAQKLLTAAALLRALGADATLETEVLADAEPDDGVVTGDLYLVGGGDSLLATREWRDSFTSNPRTINEIEPLADDIRAAGVTRVEGGIVGDLTRYDTVHFHPAWPGRFGTQGAIGMVAGLMVNDGFELPADDEAPRPVTPAPDPAEHAADVLTALLEERGVTVEGPARSGEAPGDRVTVASLPSPTVAEMVEVMLTDSDNETAEAAIKELGVVSSGDGSWEAGAAAVEEHLAGLGVDLSSIEITDGSGLSLENRLTCRLLVDLLTHPETGGLLRDGLAVAGETGTLRDAWEGTPVEGRLRGKTGTLRNVTALAGDVELAGRDDLTFAYVATVPDPGPIDPDEVNRNALGHTLVDFPHEPDLTPLEPRAAVTR